MDELMIVANVLIVFGTIYKLFELFAGRKERMMLLEKLGDRLTPDTLKNGINYRFGISSFGGLRAGCLLLGLGVGLLLGYVIVFCTQPGYFSEDPSWYVRETVGVIYGATVLFGGGLGLTVSYLIEKKQTNR